MTTYDQWKLASPYEESPLFHLSCDTAEAAASTVDEALNRGVGRCDVTVDVTVDGSPACYSGEEDDGTPMVKVEIRIDFEADKEPEENRKIVAGVLRSLLKDMEGDG